jgi:hypothetical protein
MPNKGGIKGQGVDRDLPSQVDGLQLPEKYRANYPGFPGLLEQLLDGQQRLMLDVASDIRSGLTDAQLIERYRLSYKDLQDTLKKLVDRKLVTQGELDQREPSVRREFHSLVARRCPRNYPTFSVPVVVEGDLEKKGTALDISDKGMAVAGIEANVDEVMTLTILGDQYGEFDTFSFEARCRWVKTMPSSEERLAGFEITNISKENLEGLIEWMGESTIASEESDLWDDSPSTASFA